MLSSKCLNKSSLHVKNSTFILDISENKILIMFGFLILLFIHILCLIGTLFIGNGFHISMNYSHLNNRPDTMHNHSVVVIVFYNFGYATKQDTLIMFQVKGRKATVYFFHKY